jgi:prepilin-type N-terminal cleavage/methylation domain-containing protein
VQEDRVSRRTDTLHKSSRQAGFTVIELLIVIGLGVLLCAYATVQTRQGLSAFRANGAMNAVKAKLNSIRETAMSRERDITIQFNGTNGIDFFMVNPDASLTKIDNVTLEGTNTFVSTFSSLTGTTALDTWCTDGANTWANLTTKTTLRFNSDGALIDGATRKLVSGCLYLGVSGTNSTARAVSVFGATGRMRTYRYVGTAWMH